MPMRRHLFTDAEGGLNRFGKVAAGAGVAIGVIGAVIGGLAILDKATGHTGNATNELNQLIAAAQPKLSRGAQVAADNCIAELGSAIIADGAATYRVASMNKAMADCTEAIRLIAADNLPATADLQLAILHRNVEASIVVYKIDGLDRMSDSRSRFAVAEQAKAFDDAGLEWMMNAYILLNALR